MNEPLLIVLAIAYFAVQLWLCLQAKSFIVKLIPMLFVLLLTVASVVVYCCTQNWAWLIIAFLNFGAIGLCALAWLIFGVIRLCKRLR